MSRLLSASRFRAALVLTAFFITTFTPGLPQKSTPVSTLQPLTPGIYLPVRLARTLRAGEAKVGTSITVTTTQRVPVQLGLYLHHGAKLQGTILASTPSSAAPSILSLRFTSFRYKGQTVPIATKAVAIANFTDADDTAVLATGSTDRGNSSQANWTTQQVGGDEVYRSGWVGDVCDSRMRKVGFADYYGVYSLPTQLYPDGPSLPRAMGVFSTTAAGLYGLDEGTTLTSAAGTITLTRTSGKVLLRNGDNLLLEVIPSPK